MDFSVQVETVSVLLHALRSQVHISLQVMNHVLDELARLVTLLQLSCLLESVSLHLIVDDVETGLLLLLLDVLFDHLGMLVRS